MTQSEKPKKAPSPEALERKKIKDQIISHKQGIKDLEAKLDSLTPEKQPKRKIVLSETMKLAQTQDKKTEELGNEDRLKLPAGFMSACAKIVVIHDLKKLTRQQVESVAKSSLALLSSGLIPKPEKKEKEEQE